MFRRGLTGKVLGLLGGIKGRSSTSGIGLKLYDSSR